ncbi:MAG: hypothetical protein PHU85_15360 [Phycisphaerae bacterium]|nr:hypothetical protein [Phycisphaerae bacterium]
MDRKTRICVWIILIGLANFMVFLAMYVVIGGDARNGHVERYDKRKVLYLIELRGAEARAVGDTAPTRQEIAVAKSQPDRVSDLVRLGGRTNIYKSENGKQAFKDIGRGLYIYSAVHSIIIWITIAAVMLAMLTLAKDQLVTAMEDKLISGRALIHVFATVVVLWVSISTIVFVLEFIRQLRVK